MSKAVQASEASTTPHRRQNRLQKYVAASSVLGTPDLRTPILLTKNTRKPIF
jgi:hypothetical protein